MGNYNDFNVDIKVVKASSNDKAAKASLPTCTCADRCHPGSYRCSKDCH